MLEIISAILLIGFAAALGYWKASQNYKLERIIEIVIDELARDGFVITSTDEDNNVVLEPIHPKYREMILLWEKTLKDIDEEIEKAYR